MAFVPYLHDWEYAAYGVPDATAAQVARACRLIDGHLGRPQGLVWAADAAGFPAYMANATPTASYLLTSSLAAGSSLTLSIPGARFGGKLVGQVAVLDRSNAAKVEACVVSSASGDTLTLDTVQYSHAAGATLEFGLTVDEETPVVYGGMARTRARPLARILSVSGSFRGGNRRADTAWIDELPTAGVTTQIWNTVPLSQCDIDPAGNTCWLLPGTAPVGFSRVRLQLVAGWAEAHVPPAVKHAVANAVRVLIDTGMGGNVKLLKAGDSTIERFAPGLLDADTATLLAPYRYIRL